MKRIFSFFAATLFVGSVMAEPYTLTFGYYDDPGKDKGQAETELAGLFDEASMAFVNTEAEFAIEKVYLGRKYEDASGDSIFSNLKFGTSSAAGTLKFALKDMNVDSVIFRAAQYGDTEGTDGFTVNGTEFKLSAGNKVFENVKYVPEGEISALEIKQVKASKGRFYLTSITVYPKGGEVTPPEVLTKPATAPVAPAEEEANVMAVYCNHYAKNNANFGISGWAGAYETLDIEGTKIAYWAGFTWECIIDPAHIDDAHDFSAFKNLHVDVWAPAAAKIKLSAEAVAGGDYKDGPVIELSAGWNSVDLALNEWPGGYDFKNLKCFAMDGYKTPADESFEGNPLAIANLYFFGADAPVVPEEGKAVYQWSSAEAEQVGATVLGAAGVEISTVKIHENNDEVPAIKFGNSYKYEDGKYIAIKPVEGGFKAGDELQIAVCINVNDESKEAQAAVYAADGVTELFLSEKAVNARFVAADPAVEKYVLEADQDSLLIGRKGGTGLFVISLKVVRSGEEPPVVGPAKPETAPAVPAHAAEDVLAINCATYENNLNWYPQWWGGSNVAWQNLEFDKTIVYYTPQIAFDGIFNAETSPVDASAYKKFHFDVWVPQASHITISFEGAAGYKQGVDFRLNEGWNTVDADPAWWSDRSPYDWKDVKFVIFSDYKLADSENLDECTPAGDKPFAFANFYFWKDPAPKSIPAEAPAAPTLAEEHVQALFSTTYQTNTFAFAPTSWGSQWIDYEYENGQHIWYSDAFAWDGFGGTEDSYAVREDLDMMHADVYVTVDSKLKFTFEAAGGRWKDGLAVDLKANQWNSVTIDLLNAPFDSYDFTDMHYLILEGFVKAEDGTSAEGTPVAIANVYFYPSIYEGVENVDATKVAVKRIVDGQVVIEKNGKRYNVLGKEL